MISNITPRIVWVGSDATDFITLTVSGSALTFNTTAELVVRQKVVASGVETTLALGVDYSISGGPVLQSSSPPATLVRLAGNLPSGYEISILRVTPTSQALNIDDGGDFSSSQVEAALDKLTATIQELREIAGRSVSISEFDASGVSTRLPPAQALNYLRWNALETALEAVAQIDLTGTTVSSFMENVLQSADSVEARSLLGLGALATLSSIGTGQINVNSVTFAQMADIATQRILGRNAVGTGDPEALTLTQILDFIGSAAQGDLLYRGAAAWARLGAGTSGQHLKTQGAAADPTWAAIPATITSSVSQATTSGTSFEFASIPAGVKRLTLALDQVSVSGSDNLLIQIGDAGGVETTGYTGASAANDGSGVSLVNSTAGFIILAANATRAMTGHMTITRLSGNIWVSSHCATHTALTSNGGGRKELSAELDRVRLTVTGANTFDNGNCNLFVET